MRRFRPTADHLDRRDLMTVMSPWVLGPTVPPTTNSGAMFSEIGGMSVLDGTDKGDTIRVAQATPSVVEISVSNSAGADDFFAPTTDVLEVLGGSGPTDFASDANDTLIFVGGTGDNAAKGGNGFNFLVSEGSGANVFTAGSGYTAFIAGSTGATVMNGGGAFNSASLCNGVNTFNAGAAQSVVYCYGVAVNTVNADAGDPLDVYEISPSDLTTVNGNAKTTVHQGF